MVKRCFTRKTTLASGTNPFWSKLEQKPNQKIERKHINQPIRWKHKQLTRLFYTNFPYPCAIRSPFQIHQLSQPRRSESTHTHTHTGARRVAIFLASSKRWMRL